MSRQATRLLPPGLGTRWYLYPGLRLSQIGKPPNLANLARATQYESLALSATVLSGVLVRPEQSPLCAGSADQSQIGGWSVGCPGIEGRAQEKGSAVDGSTALESQRSRGNHQ